MKRTTIFIFICLLITMAGCTKKEVEEKEERNITKEFADKNILTCKAENQTKEGKTKYTTYIFEFDKDDEKTINNVGFEESIYVSSETLENKPIKDNMEWYKLTYCMYPEDCEVKVIADNRIKTMGTFSTDNFDNIFLSKNKEELKKGLEDGSLDPYSNPYTCE